MRPVFALIALSLALAAAAGCGGSSSSSTTSTTTSTTSSTPTVTTDSTIAGEVPAAIKSKGTLIVAADATYAPNEFIGTDGKTVVGMDPDLAKALGDRTGPQGEGRQRDLRRDHPRPRRRQVRPRHVLVHRHEGAGEGRRLRHLLLGRHVVLRKATGRPDDQRPRRPVRALGRSRARERRRRRRDRAVGEVQEGRKAGVTVTVYPDQNAANLALSTGRQEVGMADSPVAGYIVKKSRAASSSSSARRTGRSRTGSRSPRTTGWRSRCRTR